MEKERNIELVVVGLIVGLVFGYVFGREHLLWQKKRLERSKSVAGANPEDPLMEENTGDESCY